jgi:hypothetical protein
MLVYGIYSLDDTIEFSRCDRMEDGHTQLYNILSVWIDRILIDSTPYGVLISNQSISQFPEYP